MRVRPAALLLTLWGSAAWASPQALSPARAQTARPSALEALKSQAEAAGARGDLEGAISGFTQALRLAPDAEAYDGRGLALEEEGRWDAAIEDFNRATSLDASFPAAFEHRAVAEDQTGRFDAAIRDYSRAIALGTGTAQIYFNRGAALEHRRLYERALEDYRAALERDPSLAAAKAGVLRLQGGQRAGAAPRR